MTEGQDLRDEALERVLENAGEDWKSKALAVVRSFPSGKRLTGEAIRLKCTLYGVVPHHHNAWGGFTRSLSRSGIIARTGKWNNAVDPTSHARQMPEYTKR